MLTNLITLLMQLKPLTIMSSICDLRSASPQCSPLKALMKGVHSSSPSWKFFNLKWLWEEAYDQETVSSNHCNGQ